MATRRTTIGNTGVVTTTLRDGVDELVINPSTFQTQPPQWTISSGSTTATNTSVTAPITLIAGGATASLPTIGNHLLGQMFIVIASSSTGTAMLSASQQINGSATQFAYTMAAANANHVVWCFATKTPSGTFNWIVASGSSV